MEDGSRPVLPINNGGSQEEVGIDDEDWEYVQEEQAEAVALVHSHTVGYGVASPSSSTSTSINTTRASDVEEGAATLAQEEDDGTGSGRRKAIKLLKDLTTVPGKVEDVIVYKLQKLQRKPRVVYLKTVRSPFDYLIICYFLSIFIFLSFSGNFYRFSSPIWRSIWPEALAVGVCLVAGTVLQAVGAGGHLLRAALGPVRVLPVQAQRERP
jgi:hypothetical protein